MGFNPDKLTLTSAIVATVCVAAIVALAVVAIGGYTGDAKSRRMEALRDQSVLRAIHQSIVVSSRDFNGAYPRPGLVAPPNGEEIAGQGVEDVSYNTTANLFSLLIMNNYFTPELCVSRKEPSPQVAVYSDYKYNLYSPTKNIYWDLNFKADLHGTSHVSYAHMPLHGEAQLREWRDTSNSQWPLLGNRGPLGGAPDLNSVTNRILDPPDSWNGYILFGDGSTQLLSKYPSVQRPAEGA